MGSAQNAHPVSAAPRGSVDAPIVSTQSASAAGAGAPALNGPKPSSALTQPIATQPTNPVAVQPEKRWATASTTKAGGSASAGSEPVSTQRRWHEEGESEPVISGPSFLGLNQPGPRRSESEFGEDGSGALDRLRASRSVDYLLDDDEPPRRGWGKVVLILVALVLAGGFGYLRWKQGGFDWLTAAGERKPAAAQTAPDAASGADSGSAGATSAPAAPPGSPSGAAASGATAVIPTDTGTSPSSPSQNPTQPPPTVKPEGGAAANSSANLDNSKQASGTQSEASDSGVATNATPDKQSSDADDSDDAEQPAAVKAVPRKPAVVKRAAPKPSPARPVDNVAEAQRYIYGRGAAQDCDRGLGMLKTAAGQSDAKAMILLGSLYSSGTCAPRDLPTAYRWFAVALHKEPDNQALQNDLQKLWSQMTQPERQLAIRLSQ